MVSDVAEVTTLGEICDGRIPAQVEVVVSDSPKVTVKRRSVRRAEFPKVTTLGEVSDGRIPTQVQVVVSDSATVSVKRKDFARIQRLLL